MKTILHQLHQKFNAALQAAYAAEFSDRLECLLSEITQSTQSQFGHYQCNNALKIGQLLKINPRDAANQIISFVNRYDDQTVMIADLQVAGPGFINITLDP